MGGGPVLDQEEQPSSGGYLVVYESGLTSFFDSKQFERKFRLKGDK